MLPALLGKKISLNLRKMKNYKVNKRKSDPNRADIHVNLLSLS